MNAPARVIQAWQAILEIDPENAEALDALVASNREALRLIGADAPRDETIAALDATITLLRAHTPKLAASLPASDAAATIYAQQSTPRMRSFIAADAGAAWKKVAVPVLAVQGTLDTQVDPATNLAAFRAAIPTDRLTIIEVPGANHLFQAATTGQPNEYALLAPKFIDGLVEQLVAWLRAR